MKKTKKILTYLLFFSLGIAIVFAADNYFKSGKNWDANVPNTENANDTWTLTGRLDLEDSRSNAYINNGYRGTLSGWINSPLFGDFYTSKPFVLKFKCKYQGDPECKDEIDEKCFSESSWDGTGPIPEIYIMSGWIESNGNGENIWGDFYTDFNSDSYFCSNKIMYLDLFSNTLGEKEIGNIHQTGDDDVFLKQEIYIQGVANINGNTASGILARGDQDINAIKVYIGNNALIKRNINKNIASIYKTYLNSPGNKANGDKIKSFYNNRTQENYYVYNYSGLTENIEFRGNTYKNRGKNLVIESDSSSNIIGIKGINSVIVNGGNIYVKSDLKNSDDNKDLLILVAKRDKNTKNGGNIYIDPAVTNIDAVLIADGSLISLAGNKIQYVKDTNQINNLRKQLLIYGRVLSANNVGINQMPFGADLYEDSNYTNNQMDGNIYDLGNLRTFNLNYGGGEGVISGCNNPDKLTPIYTLQKSWAGRKACYITDSTQNGLRGSDKINPLIIENNTHINFLNPFILKK